MQLVSQGLVPADWVADYLAVSKRTVYRLVELNEIPFHRVSPGAVRFRPSEIEAWLESLRNSGGAGVSTPVDLSDAVLDRVAALIVLAAETDQAPELAPDAPPTDQDGAA